MATAKKSSVTKVTAPLVQVVLNDRVIHLFEGDIVPAGVSDESLDHLRGLGFIADGDAPVESDTDK